MKKLYTLAAALLSTVAFAQDFTATYDFAAVTATSGATDPSPVPTAQNVTFASFTAVNPAVTENYNSSGPGRFSFNTQALGATNGVDEYASLTGAIDLTKYFQTTISPAAGYKVSLSELTFRAQRSGTGVRTYAVRTSADDFSANLGTISIDPANAALTTQDGNIFFVVSDATTQGQNGSKITISTIANITEPLVVRFYGWNAEGDGGTFSIDDVSFKGTATTVAAVANNQIEGLKVFPNPNSGSILNITSNANSTKAVAIFDVLGKQVLNTTTSNSTVNVSNLTAGVYIVKVTEEGKTATKKLIKQ